MNVSSRTYRNIAEGLRRRGIAPPLWPCKHRIEGMAGVISAIEEISGERTAQEAWLELVVYMLEFQPMLSTAVNLLSCASNSVFCEADRVFPRHGAFAMAQVVAEGDQELGPARSTIREMSDDFDVAQGLYDQKGSIAIELVRPVFMLPWAKLVGEHETNVWYLLSSSCIHMRELGFGSVGLGRDNDFCVEVQVPGKQRPQDIKLWFGGDEREGRLYGLADLNGQGLYLSDQGQDMGKVRILGSASRLDLIQEHLELTPYMSQQEIQAAFRRLKVDVA